MISRNDKAIQFQALHEEPETFVIPNPWDAGSARILAALGFKALATTSAGFAFTLGRRDGAGLVSRDEMLAHCRTIVEATDLPVSADLENCFGDDPATVAETIRRAADVGLVGGSVEDATGDPSRPIYDFEHAVERVAAAVEAARSLPFPFTLVARAENFLHGRNDFDDTLRRLQAFAEAGADVLYAPCLPSLVEIRTVCAAVAPHPVNALAARKGDGLTVENLAAAGVRRISLSTSLYRAAITGLLAAAREVRERGTFGYVENLVSGGELGKYLRPAS